MYICIAFSKPIWVFFQQELFMNYKKEQLPKVTSTVVGVKKKIPCFVILVGVFLTYNNS